MALSPRSPGRGGISVLSSNPVTWVPYLQMDLVLSLESCFKSNPLTSTPRLLALYKPRPGNLGRHCPNKSIAQGGKLIELLGMKCLETHGTLTPYATTWYTSIPHALYTCDTVCPRGLLWEGLCSYIKMEVFLVVCLHVYMCSCTLTCVHMYIYVHVVAFRT